MRGMRQVRFYYIGRTQSHQAVMYDIVKHPFFLKDRRNTVAKPSIFEVYFLYIGG